MPVGGQVHHGKLDPQVLDALALARKPRTPWCWPALDAAAVGLVWGRARPVCR